MTAMQSTPSLIDLSPAALQVALVTALEAMGRKSCERMENSLNELIADLWAMSGRVVSIRNGSQQLAAEPHKRAEAAALASDLRRIIEQLPY